MAQRGGNNNSAWIIGGSIVLAGLLVTITLILLSGGNDEGAEPSGSPSIGQPSDEPTPTKSPRPQKSPRPSQSPSPSESPSPSPSPEVNEDLVIRQAVQKQADRDRPGDVKHVGTVDFYKDDVGCPQSGQASSIMVRYTTQPKVSIYIYCKAKVRWKYMDGPIYGE